MKHFAFLTLSILTLFALLFAKASFAVPDFKPTSNSGANSSLPAVLKADTVAGDQVTKTMTATGNVELSKGTSVVYADKMVYEKNGGIVRAIGNVKVKNIEVGNLRASNAQIQDDFSKGMFFDSTMVLNDGSYLVSEKIERKENEVTVLDRATYSFCPNEQISKDNALAGKKRDFASIKTSKTTIDRNNQVMKSKHGIFRIYDVPILYTPYLRVPLPAKERQSGFLHPTYTKSNEFGLGFRIPYFFNIAPNMDLTTTPHINVNHDQFMLTNEFRHLTTYGEYNSSLEFANNKIKSTNDTTVVKRSSKEYRWYLVGEGEFDFTKNTGLTFDIKTASDRNYLRDYHFNYLSHTTSEVHTDYIKGKTYASAKTIRFQELEDLTNEKSAQFILPQLDSYIESDKSLFLKEKYSLTSNFTSINRQSGLQYNRATFTPEVRVPFNVKGNLFEISSRVQSDLYYLQENYKYTSRTTDYDSTQKNFKPEMSLNWRLPLIKKAKSNTVMIEPMANLVVSTYRKNFSKLPNEDSNNSELTVSNLFTNDRISGFDRNESGKRLSYGVKSSLFNEYGEFALTLGQSYRKSDRVQDVSIRGFGNDNKSNFVGQAYYKAKKYFDITYAFQLNETNYRNDINEVNANLTFDRFSFGTHYLLLRRSEQNLVEREQIDATSTIKYGIWKAELAATRNLVSGKIITRSLKLFRDGCCTNFGFSIIENNQENLRKPEKSYNLSISFKNL